MTPQVKELIDAVAKLGVDLTPYVKYVLLAIGAWYVLVGLMVVSVFVMVLWQFIKMSRDF